MSTFRTDIAGTPVNLNITTYGARTDEPFVAIRLHSQALVGGGFDFHTDDPEQFFTDVMAAKQRWDGRKHTDTDV